MSCSNSINNNIQSRSLWIGDIEYWMDEGFLIKIFSDFANVKNLKIIRDKTKTQSSGYGFIEFDNPEKAKEVLEELNGKPIPDTNKVLKLNWASYSAGKQAAMSNNPVTDYSIYVGDLDSSVTEEKLKDFFSKYYTSIVAAKIIIDPVNKTSKGYGFVKFTDSAECQRALTEMNGRILNGKSMKLNQASFKKMNSETNLLANQTNTPYNQFFNNYNAYASDPNTYTGNSGPFSFSQGMNYSSNGSNCNKYQQSFYNQTLNNNTNTNTNSNTNISNMNLNNFYTHNPNNSLKNNYGLDFSSSVDNLNSGSYNLTSFYYNNMNNSQFQNMITPYFNYNNGYNNQPTSFQNNSYKDTTNGNSVNNYYSNQNDKSFNY